MTNTIKLLIACFAGFFTIVPVDPEGVQFLAALTLGATLIYWIYSARKGQA
jgi:hypothetical protein